MTSDEIKRYISRVCYISYNMYDYKTYRKEPGITYGFLESCIDDNIRIIFKRRVDKELIAGIIKLEEVTDISLTDTVDEMFFKLENDL